jgi:hypothetical protein
MTEHVPAARQSRAHGAYRHIQDRRGLLVSKSLHGNEENGLTLLFRKAKERLLELTQSQARAFGRRRRRFDAAILEYCSRSLSYRAADVIDVLVVKNREQPRPEVRPRPPKMRFRQRSQHAILDEVVCSFAIVRQGVRVTAQPRNFIRDKISE